MIGHAAVRRALESDLPPVTLLLGPASIGKRTLTEHLRRHHQVHAVDAYRLVDPLCIAGVRDVIRFVGTRPQGDFKLVTGRLDGASTSALNAALKVLEEPPDTARFLLTCTRNTLPTVMSRCQVFRMGFLLAGQVRDILIEHGIAAPIATKVAVRNFGQVAPALRVATGSDERERSVVLGLVQSLAARDHDMFDRAMKVWDDAAAIMFMRWLHEVATGVFLVYTKDEAFGFDRSPRTVQALAVAVSRTSNARSRLGIRAALEPLLLRS